MTIDSNSDTHPETWLILLSKTEYRKIELKKVISGYFGDSPASLLSFIVKEEKLSQEEIEKMKDIINRYKP